MVFLLNEKYSFWGNRAPLEKSIAVLPLKYLGEPGKQYLADGTMEAILNHLSKIANMRVMSRTSVEQYRTTMKDPQNIGLELDVSYLLEGSFQKYEDNIRLMLRLINAKDGSKIWSKEYDRKLDDILQLQIDVAQTVASEMSVVISPEERNRIEKLPTISLTAK